MSSRKIWPCVAGLLALVAPVGCASFSARVPGPGGEVPPMPAHAAQKETRELSAQQAAPLCLATAEKLYATGDDREAAGLYEKARASGSRDPRIARRLAVLHARAGDSVRSRDEFAKAVAATPNDASLHNDMGYLAYSRGQLGEAEKHLRKAVQLDPGHKRGWVNLGLVLGQQQRYSESLGAFSRALPEAQAHSNLAFIYSTQGKRDEARREYRMALQMEPDLPLARTALAKLEQASPAPLRLAAPPAQLEAPPARVEAPPARVEAPLAKVEAPPVRAEAPVARVEAPPAPVVAAPAKVVPVPARVEALTAIPPAAPAGDEAALRAANIGLPRAAALGGGLSPVVVTAEKPIPPVAMAKEQGQTASDRSRARPMPSPIRMTPPPVVTPSAWTPVH